jgi:hypothetical protein
LIAEPERVRIELAVHVAADLIGRLGEGDEMILARLQIENVQFGQTVLALGHDEMPREQIVVFQHDLRAVRQQFGPVLLIGRRDGRGDESEVGRVLVGADKERAVAVVGVIFVLVFGLTGQN